MHISTTRQATVRGPDEEGKYSTVKVTLKNIVKDSPEEEISANDLIPVSEQVNTLEERFDLEADATAAAVAFLTG